MTQAVAPIPTAAAPTHVRYTVLAWFCGLSMMTYIDRVCIKQVQGDMQRDLGLTGSQFSCSSPAGRCTRCPECRSFSGGSAACSAAS